MLILIPSKDRPMQLNLLLESMTKLFKNFIDHNINIIYKFSTDDFKKGYEKVIEKYPFFNFTLENDFYLDVNSIISCNDKYTMFLMDDCVFINKLDLENSYEFAHFAWSEEIVCLSLRLNPFIKFNYTQQKEMKIPEFMSTDKGFYIWEYNGCDLDYGYPFSLDGHIFKTKDIIETIQNAHYDGPNILEYVLTLTKTEKKYMMCFPESKILNIPINRVQSVSNNIFGKKYSFSTKDLNDKFLSGYCILLDNITGINNEAVHQELDIQFLKKTYAKPRINNFFEIIIPVYNSDKWIRKCLDSIANQTYKNFNITVINDASTDFTKARIMDFISDNPEVSIQFIDNKIRNGSSLENINKAVKNMGNKNEDYIVSPIDGDDWLANDSVLDFINNIYQDPAVWLTYGNFEASNKQYSGICEEVKDVYGYRKNFQKWNLSHLRTFKLGLFKKIEDKNMRDQDGTYYSLANDVSFMLPMFEMAGKEHSRFVKDILYIYNNENPISDFRVAPQLQIQKCKEIREKEQYKPIDDFHSVSSVYKAINMLLRKENNVLDIGCGNKNYHKFFKTKNIKTVDAWKNVNPDYLINLEKERLLFEENSFDFVLMLDFIEHLKKEKSLGVIEQAKKISKKYIIILTPLFWTSNEENVNNPGMWSYGNKFDLHKSFWKEEELNNLGFRRIKMKFPYNRYYFGVFSKG